DWLFTQLKGRLTLKNAVRYVPALAGVVSIILVARFTIHFYPTLFKSDAPALVTCAHYVAALVPEEARIVVSSDSPAIENGVANNYEDPTIFFFSHRYGWSLAADEHTPAKIEEFQQEGAQYFVIYNSKLLSANPGLAAYLQATADQIGPGVDAGCG